MHPRACTAAQLESKYRQQRVEVVVDHDSVWAGATVQQEPLPASHPRARDTYCSRAENCMQATTCYGRGQSCRSQKLSVTCSAYVLHPGHLQNNPTAVLHSRTSTARKVTAEYAAYHRQRRVTCGFSDGAVAGASRHKVIMSVTPAIELCVCKGAQVSVASRITCRSDATGCTCSLAAETDDNVSRCW